MSSEDFANKTRIYGCTVARNSSSLGQSWDESFKVSPMPTPCPMSCVLTFNAEPIGGPGVAILRGVATPRLFGDCKMPIDLHLIICYFVPKLPFPTPQCNGVGIPSCQPPCPQGEIQARTAWGIQEGSKTATGLGGLPSGWPPLKDHFRLAANRP
jgi:hypothetical protein